MLNGIDGSFYTQHCEFGIAESAVNGCAVAGLASMYPYIPVYLKMLGLTPSETSVTCGVTLLVSGITRTLIGGWADKLNAHKSTMVILCLVSAVFHCAMLIVPQRAASDSYRTTIDVQLHCGENGSHLLVCSEEAVADGRMEKVCVTNNRTLDGEAINATFNSGASCKLQCGVQQNTTGRTGEVCFVRSERENCSALHRNRTFVFNVNLLQSQPAEVCPAMTSDIGGGPVCRCYPIRSLATADAAASERIVCRGDTKLACSTDCALDREHSYAGNTTYSFGRKGLHFGWTFVSVFALYFIGMFAFQPLVGLVDAMAYTFLGEERHKWGQQRTWGTVGFGSFALVSGLSMDAFSSGRSEYAVAFILFAAFMILSAACASRINVNSVDVETSPNMFHDVIGLLRRPDACALVCLLVFLGMYEGLIRTFLFWYLRQLGDAPQVLFGMCITFNSIPEIFMLFFSGAVLRRIGHVLAMSIAIVAFAVRLGSYSLLRNPWMVLAIEPLHAFTFGLMYASASTYASRITPPGSHGAVQNMIGSLYFCIGKFRCVCDWKWDSRNKNQMSIISIIDRKPVGNHTTRQCNEHSNISLFEPDCCYHTVMLPL